MGFQKASHRGYRRYRRSFNRSSRGNSWSNAIVKKAARISNAREKEREREQKGKWASLDVRGKKGASANIIFRNFSHSEIFFYVWAHTRECCERNQVFTPERRKIGKSGILSIANWLARGKIFAGRKIFLDCRGKFTTRETFDLFTREVVFWQGTPLTALDFY